MCLPLSSLSPGRQTGHSLVLTPLRNDLTVRFMFFSAQGRAQQYTYNFISFHKLPPLCDLTLSVPREPTFLVIWLEIQAFSFLTVEHTSHNCVNLFGQVARGSRIKETGILPFLLGLQYLPKNRVFFGTFGACLGAATIATSAALLLLEGRDQSEREKQKGDFLHLLLSIGALFSAPQTKNRGLIWSFFFVHLVWSFNFLDLGWGLLEKQKVGNLPPIWRCSILFFFFFSVCLLPFTFSGPQIHLSTVFSCILWEKWSRLFHLDISVFQVKSNDMFSMQICFFPPQKVNILGR